MKIVEFLRPDCVIDNLTGKTGQAVLSELCRPLAQSQKVDGQKLLETLLEREKLGSTGIGDGVAIPHGKVKNAKELVLAFGRSHAGVDFNSLDGRPAQLFFLLIAPEEAVGVHLKMLARISRILKDPLTRKQLLEAPDAASIYTVISEQDSSY